MKKLLEMQFQLGLIETVIIVFIFVLFILIFRKLKTENENMISELMKLGKESESDAYIINFLTREKEHLSDLNDTNEREIKILKTVLKSQEKIIKELTTELEPVETKVYDSVFSLPIQEPKKPI